MCRAEKAVNVRGRMRGSGQMNLALAVGAAIGGALGADVLWYSLGRLRGTRLLETVCRFRLNPDSVVRDAKERFVAHGVRYVVPPQRDEVALGMTLGKRLHATKVKRDDDAMKLGDGRPVCEAGRSAGRGGDGHG